MARGAIAALAGLLALARPAAADAAEIDLLQEFRAFALREPPDPPPPGGARIYSATGDKANWFVSQWNIAGGKLSPFARRQSGGVVSFEAHAATANVRIAASQEPGTVKLSQNGALLPCLNGRGAPRESDLFISPGRFLGRQGNPRPLQEGRSPSLAELTALVQSVTVTLRAGAAANGEGCQVNKGNALVAVILRNEASLPKQTMFYQLALNRFCAPAACGPPPPVGVFFFGRNPLGFDETLPMAGKPFLTSGQQHDLRIDLLPRLKHALAAAPDGTDRDPAHWVVSGAYLGQHIYGNITLESEWRNVRLVAVTPDP